MAIHSIKEVVPYAANFSVVVVMLAVILRKPLRKFVYQRHERMKDSVESATIAHDRALARINLAKSAMRDLPSEERSLLERERSHAEAEKAELIQKTKQEVSRLAGEADRLAQAEQEAANEQVKEQFLQMVVEQAEEKLKGGLKRDDHSAILKRAQNSIEVGV